MNNYGACNNPTFTQGGQDILLKDAPYPTKCQKVGSPLNCDPSTGASPSPGATTSGSGSTSTTGTGGTTTTTADAGTGTGTGTGGTGGATANPLNYNVTGSVISVPSNGADNVLLAVITGLGVAVAIAAPPSVAAYLRRRRVR